MFCNFLSFEYFRLTEFSPSCLRQRGLQLIIVNEISVHVWYHGLHINIHRLSVIRSWSPRINYVGGIGLASRGSLPFGLDEMGECSSNSKQLRDTHFRFLEAYVTFLHVIRNFLIL